MKKDRAAIQQEALKALEGHERAAAAISMRMGKTRLGLEYLRKYDPKSILIVGPKKNLQDVWKQEAEENGYEDLLPRCKFSTYLSLNKQNPNDFDQVIFDEVHTLKFSHLVFLDNYQGRILGLTGTPPKYEKGERAQMIQRFCPIVYTYLVKDATDEGILNDYRIYVHSIALEEKEKYFQKTKAGGFYTTEKKSYDYWCNKMDVAYTSQERARLSIMLMKTMQGFESKIKYAKELLKNIHMPTIVFANTMAQADELSMHSYHSGNSESEANLKRFRDRHITRISAVLQLSEGITLPAEAAVCLHTFANERTFLQRAARCLSLPPDKTAHIHVLGYKNTIDMNKWIPQALEPLDPEKIIYI